MIEYRWNPEKDDELVLRHGIGFEAVLEALESGRMIADIVHPKPERYPGQRMLVLDIAGYVWVAPYVSADGYRFLKTMFPSRKYLAEFKGKQ